MIKEKKTECIFCLSHFATILKIESKQRVKRQMISFLLEIRMNNILEVKSKSIVVLDFYLYKRRLVISSHLMKNLRFFIYYFNRY